MEKLLVEAQKMVVRLNLKAPYIIRIAHMIFLGGRRSWRVAADCDEFS